MKADRFYSLFFLLLAMALGVACGARSASRNSSFNNSTEVSGNGTGNRGGVSSKEYSDPDDAFAIKIPDNWKVEREEKDGAYLTVFHPDQYRAANLSIMTIKAAPAKTDSAELKSHTLVESSKPFFQGWIDGLRGQARVEGTGAIYPTRFNNYDALRMDVTYYRNDADDPRHGYSVFLLGDRVTFFISLTASQSHFKEMEEIISTMHIGP